MKVFSCTSHISSCSKSVCGQRLPGSRCRPQVFPLWRRVLWGLWGSPVCLSHLELLSRKHGVCWCGVSGSHLNLPCVDSQLTQHDLVKIPFIVHCSWLKLGHNRVSAVGGSVSGCSGCSFFFFEIIIFIF